jgi:NifU-like protein involved in Fe-S cluster formation
VVTPQLRALATKAEGAGRLDANCSGAQRIATGRGEHPVCGDEVEVDLLLEGDRIVDLRWRAHGCPATYAVAAAAHRAMSGVAIADAPSILRQALAQLGDLAPTERHAEAMFCRAMAAACGKAGG